jgi:hypothetical protein
METKYPDKWQEKRRAKPVCFVSRNQKRPRRHFYCFLETKHAKNPGLFPMFPFSCVSTSTLICALLWSCGRRSSVTKDVGVFLKIVSQARKFLDCGYSIDPAAHDMSAWNSFEASARGYEATFHSEQASTSSTGAQKRTIDVEDDAEVVAVAPPQTNKLSTTMPATKKLATAGNWLAAAKPKLPTQAPSLWSTHALKGSGAKDSLIVRRDPSMIPRTKIAAFDFDGTLTENAGHATSKVSSQLKRK